jgi:hypothetical protein
MTHYKLNRYEKNKNHINEITSIFIAITCHDQVSGDGLRMEKWLNQEEQDLVIFDEENLKTILHTLCAEGCIRLEKQIANKPKPTEYGNIDIEIDAAEVDIEIEALKNIAEENQNQTI